MSDGPSPAPLSPRVWVSAVPLAEEPVLRRAAAMGRTLGLVDGRLLSMPSGWRGPCYGRPFMRPSGLPPDGANHEGSEQARARLQGLDGHAICQLRRLDGQHFQHACRLR